MTCDKWVEDEVYGREMEEGTNIAEIDEDKTKTI